MTPGSLLFGNVGQCFECGHDHASGDRCVAFHFSPELFERIAADAGVPRGARSFRMSRVPLADVLARHTPDLLAVPGVNGTGEGQESGEPVLIVFMGAVIAFIAFSILMPILQLNTAIH